MKCHAGVEFPDGAPCPRCNAKLGEVCWPGINADLIEVASLRVENTKLREQLASSPARPDGEAVAWQWYRDGVIVPITEEHARHVFDRWQVLSDDRGGAMLMIKQLWAEIDRLRASPPPASAGVREDARRYQRLRILGAAPGESKQLENRTVLRFTGLDAFIDADLVANPSRGEAALASSVEKK